MTIDTPLILKLYMAPPVPVLTGLYCIWLLSHSSLGRRIGGGGGGAGEGVKIWEYCLTEFCFLGWQDCTLCFRHDSTSFPGFSPTRPFKSYQYCRNCKMKANRLELRDTRGDKKAYEQAPKPTSLVTTLCNIFPTSLTFVDNGQRRFSSDSSAFCLLENHLSIEITSLR